MYRTVLTKNPRFHSFAPAALAAAALAACGGGASSSDPVPPAALTLTGVVATGAAVAGASVKVSCASGTGTATATANGSYTVSVTGGSLPCVLEATGTSSTGAAVSLHSVATGSGTTATVNVTPLTELLVAQLTGQDPAAYFTSASSNAASLSTTLTSTAVSTAATAVTATLTAAGVNTSGVTDIVSGALSAGTGTGYDGVLDTLATTLTASGSTLSTLVTTVATTSAASSSSGGSAGGTVSESSSTSMLPASLLLKAKAPSCSALRNTNYRFIIAKNSGGTNPALDTGTLDATNANGPTWTWSDGTTDTMTPVSGDACHYTMASTGGGSADIVVAPSGVLVARSSNTSDSTGARDTSFRMVIALPVQTIALSELAGIWNFNGWNWDAGTGTASADGAILTIGSDGTGTGKCSSPVTAEASCTARSATYQLSSNTAGGFNLVATDSTGSDTLRVFAYRAGNGKLVVVGIDALGSLIVGTPVVAMTPPAVGDSHSAWNITLDASQTATDAVVANSFAVTAVNAGANTYDRTVTALSTGISHTQTMTINSARSGWQYRAAGTATGSDGSSVTVREMYALPLGVGLTGYYLPANNKAGTNARFAFSVKKSS